MEQVSGIGQPFATLSAIEAKCSIGGEAVQTDRPYISIPYRQPIIEQRTANYGVIRGADVAHPACYVRQWMFDQFQPIEGTPVSAGAE